MADPVQFTRGTLAAWLASTKVLLDGQLGYVRHSDGTFEPKMGNGADEWEDLPGQKLPTSAVARYTTIDVVADHGADRTGSTSSAAAFDAALTAANAAGGKVVIDLPPGLYDVTAGLSTVITASHVWIRGSAMGVTMLKGQTGTLFDFDNAAGLSGGGISDMSLWYPTPDSASRAIHVGAASSIKCERLYLDNVRQLAELGEAGTAYASGISFSHVYGATDPSAGSVVIDAVYGAALHLDDVILSAKGVGFPTDATSAHPALDTTFLRFGQGSWDTVHAVNVITNRYNRGLNFDIAAASVCSNMWFTGCVFDYCKTNAVRLNTTHAGANIRSLYFTTCWAVATDGHSVELGGSAGTITNVHFAHCVARQSGKNGWRFTSGPSMSRVVLDHCHELGANRLNATNIGTEKDGVVILASGVSVLGGSYGENGSSYTGFTNQARYGITAGGDVTAWKVTDVDSDGSTGAFQLGTNTSGSVRRLATQNRSNRSASSFVPEYATTSRVTAPRSAATQTHMAATVDTLYIYGGTVTDIKHNGTTVATAGPATLVLRPGDTWAVTYSVAPTLKRVVSA